MENRGEVRNTKHKDYNEVKIESWIAMIEPEPV